MLKHVATPRTVFERVVFETESMMSQQRISKFLTSVRANYETTKALRNFPEMPIFVDFQIHPISSVVT